MDYTQRMVLYCFFYFLFLFVSSYQLPVSFISKNKVCVEYLETLACLPVMSPLIFTPTFPPQIFDIPYTSVTNHKFSAAFGGVITQRNPSQEHLWSPNFHCWSRYLLAKLLGIFYYCFLWFVGIKPPFILQTTPKTVIWLYLCNSLPLIIWLSTPSCPWLISFNKRSATLVGKAFLTVVLWEVKSFLQA